MSIDQFLFGSLMVGTLLFSYIAYVFSKSMGWTEKEESDE